MMTVKWIFLKRWQRLPIALLSGALLFCLNSAVAEVSGDRQHLNARFNDTTLETALTEIADATGIEIITSQALDKPVLMSYSNISAEKLLKRLLHRYNAMYLKDPQSGQLKTVRIFAGSNARPANITLPNQESGDEAILHNGGYYMTVLLNGTAVQLLVDTGANTLALSQATAARLSLAKGQITNINTAAGKSNAHRTIIDSVTMAGKELKGVQAIILPNLQENGLIGQNVLAHFKRITHGEQMRFEPLGMSADNDANNPSGDNAGNNPGSSQQPNVQNTPPNGQATPQPKAITQ